MENFTYYSPTKIIFGKGTLAELQRAVPADGTIMLTYGGGSIKRNGVYDQVMQALRGRRVIEFGGIPANPALEVCTEAVRQARREGVSFLLAVGGGSVLDGTKFIAAVIPFEGEDPWQIVIREAPVTQAVPLGCVLTLPATGSETNPFAVISRRSSQEKRAFSSDLVRPQFAILDPETTFSLPERQTANGIVDAFVHVVEQYLTYPSQAPLQDRQAEAILLTLIENGPRALRDPRNFQLRATLMWCATQALSGLIGCGVPHDWTTHQIGHELTALYGIDHAQSLAVVLPGALTHELPRKKDKLLQYAARVWGISSSEDDSRRCEEAIRRTEEFFRSLGVKTRLSEYGIPAEASEEIAKRFEPREKLGEHGLIGPVEVREILSLR